MRRIWLKFCEQSGKRERAGDRAGQQHDVQERDDARALVGRREIGCEREAGRLRRVQADADQQEGERRAGDADPGTCPGCRRKAG